MMKVAMLVLSVLITGAAHAQQAPSTDAKARAALLGSHLLTLQWIGSDKLGSAKVTDEEGTLRLKGEQKKGDDFVTVDGTITSLDAKTFTFEGTITTRVSHIAKGQPCERKGKMTFAITGKRKYWRLQQMDNPCEGVTDYVDLYLRK